MSREQVLRQAYFTADTFVRRQRAFDLMVKLMEQRLTRRREADYLARRQAQAV